MSMVDTSCADEEVDGDFLFDVYASSRLNEVKGWGWTHQEMQHFLQMQFQCQQHSYHMYYPDLNTRIILFQNEKAGRLLIANSEERINIVDLTLLPEFQNIGIGTHILEEVLTEAKACKRSVQLSVARNNDRAIRLYERLGFQHVHADEMYIQMEWRQL
ncbi:N-acetyltransferase [Bacillus tianshenii]|nr:N-acetyltransferase [Bacillus tianshenii]